jgi:hypothetical protein
MPSSAGTNGEPKFPTRWQYQLCLYLIIAEVLLHTSAGQAIRKISEDRDLKEIHLAGWDCLNKPGGSARTPDGQERNRLKNRSPVDVTGLRLQDLDVAGFLKTLAPFDALTKGKRRKDIGPAEREQLDPMEKELVQVTGYLGVAYCGPPETTNCASMDFHDWHLEVFEKPIEHPPQPGDTTPIVCEITPRAQNAIYAEKIRIQELTAFFRRADLEYEATGHAARKIRVIGYRLWDDEHNGRADVGTTVRRINPNKYHNPWRQTAWEIHPVVKIVPLDSASTNLPPPLPSPIPSVTPATSRSPAPSEKTPTPPPSPNPAQVEPQFVTVTEPVKIPIPYGQTILPRGAKLPIMSHDAKTVTVQYMGGTYAIPISSTDLQ